MSDAALLMDRVYRQQRHIYDATRKFYLLGRDGLISDLAMPDGAHVLEIGCGTGRNLIKIARSYPTATCYGLDISQAMLATARKSVAKAGLDARIQLADADATSFDPERLFNHADFDRVVISYALSMIPPWRSVLRHGAGVVAPGGALHLVDFGTQDNLPLIFKHMLCAWLARFHVVPRDTLTQEIDTVARDLGLHASSSVLYGGYTISGRMTRVSLS